MTLASGPVWDSVAATPLVPLRNLAAGLLGKIELGHPSGSMKHRAIPARLAALRKGGLLGHGQRIVVHSAGSAAVTTAWAGAQLGCPVDAVVPRSIGEASAALLEWFGARVHRIASNDAPGLIVRLVRDGGLLLDQFADEQLIDGYRSVAREILEAADVDAVVVGIGTGLSITGIGREVKLRRPSCLVVGVEPAEAQLAAGQPWSAHGISGLAPPMPRPLLDASVIDLLLPVTTREAWDRARALACREGILAGPSSGATVAAAEHLLRTGRCRNPVAIVAGGMLEHLKFSENTAAG